MAEKKDAYAHRAHRQKYKLGYGCEGAERGINHVGGDADSVDPRLESDKVSESAEKEIEDNS